MLEKAPMEPQWPEETKSLAINNRNFSVQPLHRTVLRENPLSCSTATAMMITSCQALF